MKKFFLARPFETKKIARLMAPFLTPPLMIALNGGLGSGKTTFTQGLAEGFQIDNLNEVVSPTFSLAHEYQGLNFFIFHLDIYRLTLDEFLDAGLDDYINQRGRAKKAISIIEWADKYALDFWPKNHLTITLSDDKIKEGRWLTLSTPPDFYALKNKIEQIFIKAGFPYQDK